MLEFELKLELSLEKEDKVIKKETEKERKRMKKEGCASLFKKMLKAEAVLLLDRWKGRGGLVGV